MALGLAISGGTFFAASLTKAFHLMLSAMVADPVSNLQDPDPTPK